jgi:hypothetical protein
MRFVLTLVAAAFASAAFAQTPNLSDLPPLPPVREKVVSDPDAIVHASAKTPWKAWLAKHFPDAAASWPADAAKAFSAPVGEWDFVGKADYDRDGVPTAVLLRFARPKKPSAEVFSRVRVMKWRDKKWTAALEFDTESGARMNGVELGEAKGKGFILDFARGDAASKRAPGMVIYMELANSRGVAMTESVRFYQLAATKKYAVDD